MSINTAQIKLMHALLNELNLMEQKRDLVLSTTGGRTDSSRGMSYDEAQALIESLQAEKANTIEPMRKKVIHLLCLLGYVDDIGKPNMRRIQYFVQNRTGKNNPRKKALHLLTIEETRKVLNQVTVIYNKELKRQTNNGITRAD